MKKLLIIAAVGATLLSSVAQAVPWCHHGTIVQIANVNWSGAQIAANFTGSVPGGVADAEVYTTFTATHNYAQTFAGGGGGFGGYSVPGSGQVRVVPYAPNSYTNMVGPGYYYTSQGVSFKMDKCYTIPPMTHHHEVSELSVDDGSGIVVKPLEGLEKLEVYWQKDITDPNEDSGRK
jgi:hypothetical protein